MNRVIVISTVGLIYDGITSVIVSYLEAMNREDFEFFVVDTIQAEPQIKKKIEDLGCTLVSLPSRKNDTYSYFYSLVSFIKKNEITVLHAHGNSATLSIELFAGWLGGCKKRIAHSHNTKCDHKKADLLLRPLFNLLYTDALACGKEAGKWLFKNRKFIVLKNGRNIEKYAFNNKTREVMRDKLNIKDRLVFGHVGGFYEQKNHVFLMEIFREIIKLEPNSIFMVIGDGPLREKIKKKVSDIENRIKFIGKVDDVENYLQAMDAMILPSFFEGLPLVVIEWQINGLPSLLADTITKECAITHTVYFESLNSSPEEWAKKILELAYSSNRNENSKQNTNLIRNAGFDIKDNAQILRNIYLK